jgi:hypothetical protein
VLEGLLDPEGMLGNLPHELFAGAGEIAQLLDGRRRHEAAADQPVGQEVGDPSGVAHVALAAGNVADMPGVGEDELEPAFEDLPDGFPVHARGFHRDVRTAVGRQPVAQRHQVRGGRAEGPPVVRDGRARHDARTGHHGPLMDIESSALRMQQVHDALLGAVASAWSPRQRSLEGALSGIGPVAAVRGARGAPGPTSLRALRTNAKPTSRPTRVARLAHFMRRGSAKRVGN